MNHLVQRLREKSRLGYWPLLGDEAADEIERLTQALKKANDQAEHFEREWYLRGDEIERLRAALNDIAQHQDSEWPLRCRMNVRTARAALKEPT